MALQTPIALLIFNRPDLTQRVFSAIAAQTPQKLLIVADGPRDEAEAILCQQTRHIVSQIDWPCEVLTNFSEANLGCKERISSGLDWVFSHVEEAIILEDDCYPSPSFFSFCEAMLCYWKHDERIMMVAGTNYLTSHAPSDKADYFFSRYYAIWGWATWRRAWRYYDKNFVDWPYLDKQQQLRAYFAQPFMRTHLTTSFEMVHKGLMDTWDIQWFASCLFQNGLSIVPRVNLIETIGIVGTHGSGISRNHFRPVFELDTGALCHPAFVTPDLSYEKDFFEREFKPGSVDFLKQTSWRVARRLLRPTIKRVSQWLDVRQRTARTMKPKQDQTN